jgi:hypothetical protein
MLLGLVKAKSKSVVFKSVRSACLLTIWLSFNVYAQQPAPAPATTPPPQDVDVVKITTNLIRIDVS